MKFQFKDIQLTGKGFVSSAEILRDNVKIVFGEHKTQFFELVVPDGEETKRIGWLLPNSFEILADFTIHTEKGMKGKSTEDLVEAAMLLDFDGYLTDIIPDTLMDLDVTDSQQILEKMLEDPEKMVNSRINIHEMEDEKGLIVISPRSNYVFVKTDDASIRIAKEGVYVLKLEDGHDKLVMIDKNKGVHVLGEKEVIISSSGGIVINGKPFDIGSILEGVTKSLNFTMVGLEGLGPMFAGLASIGPSISKDINKKLSKLQNLKFDFDFSGLEDLGENLGRSFEKAFSGFDDWDDLDDDFDDAYDVDIDF